MLPDNKTSIRRPIVLFACLLALQSALPSATMAAAPAHAGAKPKSGAAAKPAPAKTATPSKPAVKSPADEQYDKLMEAGRQAVARKALGDAEKNYQDAVKHAEQFGKNDLRYAEALNSLGLVYGIGGKPIQAETLLKEALKIKEQGKTVTVESLNSTIFDLANIYYNQKRFSSAEPLYKRVVENAEKDPVLRKKETLILQTMYLGDCYASNKKPADAEVAYKKTLAMMDEKIGSDSKMAIPILNKLGDVMYEQKKFNEVIPVMEREAKLLEKSEGPSHVILALVLNNLADVYLKVDKLPAAEVNAKKSMQILQANLNPDDGAHIAVLDTMAEIYRAQKKYTEAEPLFKKAISIAKFSGEDGKEHLVTAMKHYAELLRQTERNSEAQSVEDEMKKIDSPAESQKLETQKQPESQK
jgi:tetratricopeptide (TPR) repeat protein